MTTFTSSIFFFATSSALLIVVEDGDLHLLLQTLFDLEAIGRGDVFEVDAAERGLEELHAADELLGVPRVDFDVEHVDVREPLEEDALSFHHRLAGHRADVAESEDRGAVADHRDEVAFRCVFVGRGRIGSDFETRLGDSWRVREREIALRRRRLGGDDLDLSRSSAGVIVEGVVALVVSHAFSCARSL
jgi:hypothetical protein